MEKEALEIMVEDIMRAYYFGDYESYTNEELREQYRKMLQEAQ